MKEFRKIIVDKHSFSWTVRKTRDHVKIRCYHTKSTYVELIFNWGITLWAVNFYQPSTIAAIIKYAIASGWSYQSEKQTLMIPASESEAWIENAGIINYTALKQYLSEKRYQLK